MTTLTISDARANLADAVNRVVYAKERLLLDRRGKVVAALVSAEDLKLLEVLEDTLDAKAARKALAEKGERPYGEVRKRLGL